MKKGIAKRAVIVGAGGAGDMIIKRLQENCEDGYYPVASVDDDPQKINTHISGVPVAGAICDIADVVKKYRAEEIIIAVPTATKDELKRIYAYSTDAAVPVKIFRSIVDVEDFVKGEKEPLKEVPFEELLLRDVVHPDMERVRSSIKGKTVLVTGGAGSIGSEICRQVLLYGCERLIVFDINENGLFEINEELKGCYSSKYRLCLGSIRDFQRLDQVFKEYRPDIVLHAAAHKHVPMMEINPIEAVKNNVYGTRNVIEACIKNRVRRFVLISTDKAVNPTNIMGATKRIAELMVEAMNSPACEMFTVRFGNVLGSNGSVFNTFRKQIREGGPITITDIDIERYFMTIPEAVSLVLCASAQNSGGTFILDMGKPIKIYDLARDMVRFYGLEPDKDIKIEIIGLRKGEKLFEELKMENEIIRRTEQEKIFVIKGERPSLAMLNIQLNKLRKMIENGSDEIQIRDFTFYIIGTDRAREKIEADNEEIGEKERRLFCEGSYTG